MDVLLPMLSVAGGLVLVLVGAEVLVRGAASLAKRMSIPEIVIGLTYSISPVHTFSIAP